MVHLLGAGQEIKDGDDTVDIIGNILERKRKWVKSIQ
jgi:hypothetical protein